jgi:hypothetical protein
MDTSPSYGSKPKFLRFENSLNIPGLLGNACEAINFDETSDPISRRRTSTPRAMKTPRFAVTDDDDDTLMEPTPHRTFCKKLKSTKEFREVFETNLGSPKCVYWFSLLEYDQEYDKYEVLHSNLPISWILHELVENDDSEWHIVIKCSFQGVEPMDIIKSALLVFILDDTKIKW